MKKVLVIGLDGATFDNLKPWIKEGKLPNFSNIMKNGFHAPLKSTVPHITLPAWTSLFTGKTPGKHGIFDFIKIRPDYETQIFTLRDVNAKAVWKMLSEAGRKVCVINVPMTYPPEKVNGCMISGAPCLTFDEDSTYPKALWMEVSKEVPDYKILETGGFGQFRDSERLMDEIHTATESRAKAVRYLIEKKEWDFFMVVFFACDIIQHAFWKYMDAAHPAHTPEGARKYGNVLLAYYQKIDSLIGDILGRVDQNTTIMIVSDHGGGPLYKGVFINNWLMEKNLLKLKETDAARNMLIEIRRKFNKLLFRYDSVKKINKLVPGRIKKKFSLSSMNIDWTKTKISLLTPGGQALVINKKGKYENGIVEPGKEYEDLRDFVMSELQKLEDPETGKKIINKVCKREEIHSGPLVKNASDLYILPIDGYEIQGGIGPSGLIGKPMDKYFTIDRSGAHREYGICMIKGPNIKKIEIERADITDITPTILHIMGMPIPDDLDGKVLTDAFEESFLAENPVRYQGVEDERERVREKIKELKTLDRI